jgi:crotonobetainyl-CoA:carnitine CoA-transferase CaiB-like acyl-CoA transferase
MARLGFSYEELQKSKPDIVYVSNCGFGAWGPNAAFKTWGPIVQAVSGLTFSSGLAGEPPAGWGFSYMDHMGAYSMAVAILAGLLHRKRTGEGQWIDMACTEAGATFVGPDILDYTVNGRPLRRHGQPDSNRSHAPARAPHGIYPAVGDDNWIAIACRDDADWANLAAVIDEPWATDSRNDTLAERLAVQDALDRRIGAWTATRDRFATAVALRAAGVPAAAVARPEDRIDHDPATSEWGLWPTVHHREMGDVRVDGLPVHLSETDWVIEHGGPCLGEHTHHVLADVLGLDDAEIEQLAKDGIT